MAKKEIKDNGLITAKEMRAQTEIKRPTKLALAKNKVCTSINNTAEQGHEFIIINSQVWLGDMMTDGFIFNDVEIKEFITELKSNGFEVSQKDDGSIEIRW